MAVSSIVPSSKSKGNTPPKQSRFLDPHEAAVFLGVAENTMAQWRMKKVGPPYSKFNRFLVRYAVEDLIAYATARKVTHE